MYIINYTCTWREGWFMFIFFYRQLITCHLWVKKFPLFLFCFCFGSVFWVPGYQHPIKCLLFCILSIFFSLRDLFDEQVCTLSKALSNVQGARAPRISQPNFPSIWKLSPSCHSNLIVFLLSQELLLHLSHHGQHIWPALLVLISISSLHQFTARPLATL